MKKERSNEENFQGGLRRGSYTDGRTNDTTRNIGVDWKEIENDGRARNP